MKQKYYIMAILVVILSICLFQSCDKDCPVCPSVSEPGAYYVYMADDSFADKGKIWIIDSSNDSLIDSIQTRLFIRDMVVSPSGDLMAIGYSFDSIFVYDLNNKVIISQFESYLSYGSNSLVFNNTGQDLIVRHSSGQIICKYDVSNGQLIAQDSVIMTFDGRAINHPYIYGITGTYDSTDYVLYNYETMSITKKHPILRANGEKTNVFKSTISTCDNYLYLIVEPNRIFKYEIESDSIIDSVTIVIQATRGDIKCSPDGRYIIASEVPGFHNMFDLVYYPGTFVVINNNPFESIRRISSWDAFIEAPIFPTAYGELILIPDGSKAYSLGISTNDAYPPIALDINNFTAKAVEGIKQTAYITHIAVGGKIDK